MMMIRITAKREGFRRVGLAHPAAATDHPADAFSAEQLAQLKAEPMLIVDEIQAEQSADPNANPEKGKAVDTSTPPEAAAPAELEAVAPAEPTQAEPDAKAPPSGGKSKPARKAAGKK